ncbi:MAG: glycosyltransferase [Prevotellaceae bacterium]|jgi:glycosyltransferase involved in cell wall biosynthesis|nr:glycosyltransferase [Prevotellaceae bacterium]
MFSVIIPLYNKAKYIEKAINSVVNQTFKDWELIVIDDGSTDNSLEIAKQFTIYNLQFTILTQENSGVSTARNNGVKAAKYDYIAFLDADDWWQPTFLEEIKNLIDDFPEGVLFASSYFKVKNGKNIPAKIGVPDGFERGYFDYMQAYINSLYMPITSITAVIKKGIFDEMGGFKPNLTLGEDFDLWLRIALKYKVVLVNKPLAFYNQDVEQQSRGVAFDKIYEPETIFIFNLDYLENEEKNNPILKQMLDNLRVYTLTRYYIHGKYTNEFKYEIAKVDMQKQPKKVRKLYKTPRQWLLLKNRIFFLLKNIKNTLSK